MIHPNPNVRPPIPTRAPQDMIPSTGSTVRPSFGGSPLAQAAAYARKAHKKRKTS